MATDTSTSAPRPDRRPVLVAVDGSDASRRALRWAAATASALGVTLKVVRSWEYPSSLPLPFARLSVPSAEELDGQVLEELTSMVTEELGDLESTELEVLRGPAASALVTAVTNRSPRMLVVGSRGLGGFKGLLLGSVSRQLLEHAPCTVVVVPSTTSDAPALRRVLVGVDGSTASDRALEWASELTRATGAELTVLHAFSPPFAEIPPQVVLDIRDEADQLVQRQRQNCGVEEHAATEVVDGDPRQVLVDRARDVGADLTVVGETGQGSMRHVLGAVSSHLSSHTPVPLAVVRLDDGG